MKRYAILPAKLAQLFRSCFRTVGVPEENVRLWLLPRRQDADFNYVWRPDSSLIASGITPTSGESNDTDLSLEYAFGWKWGEGWELDGGLRWFSLAEEEDHFTEWAPSVVFKVPLVRRELNAHVEYFSLLSVDREEDYQQHYVGPGAHYLITPNLEVGARVFWGLSDQSAEFISNVGMGLRF